MDDEDAEWLRWYGPWAALTPTGAAGLLTGVTVPWWVVGGWAVDAHTGRDRDHEDIDVAIFREDLPTALRELREYCVWAIFQRVLTPVREASDVPDGCRQLWVRRDGASPWLFELLLTPRVDGDWVCVRDDRIRMPLAEALSPGRDGVRFLRPKIVLLLKAALDRPKDRGDRDAVLPLLPPERRTWLAQALDLVHPGHPWRSRLD